MFSDTKYLFICNCRILKIKFLHDVSMVHLLAKLSTMQADEEHAFVWNKGDSKPGFGIINFDEYR